MLILKAEQVQFYQVLEGESGLMQPSIALGYNGRLFSHRESFALDQRKNAISRIQTVLDQGTEQLPILLETSYEFSLWYLNQQVQLLGNIKYDPTPEATHLASEDEPKSLFTRLRQRLNAPLRIYF